jgi:hypothetical protein
VELILQGCLWIVRKLTGEAHDGPGRRDWRARHNAREVLALRLFLAAVFGVPALVLLWGYATGRLPAPSPYTD